MSLTDLVDTLLNRDSRAQPEERGKRYKGHHIAENMWKGRTTVPPHFVGTHCHRWPVGDPLSPGIQYRYNLWRSLNYDFTHWLDLHTAPGFFEPEAVRRMDQAIDAHAQHGAYTCFALWGTPRWCSSEPNRTSPYYGHTAGGSACPTSMDPVREYVDWIMRRYNTDEMRDNHGRKNIRWIESWNEPIVESLITPETITYWTGTMSQLAEMTRAVKQAAKAVDPDVICLGPSHCGFQEVADFLNAPDNHGGFGRDHVDGVAWHPYATNLVRYPKLNNYSSEVGIGDAYGIDNCIRANIVEGGLPYDFPVYGMEQAMVGDHNHPAITEWPPEQKARYVAGVTAMYAALGWRTVTWYSHDNNLFGEPAENGISAAACDWCYDLGGKTLLSIDRAVDGAIIVEHTRGQLVF